VAPAEAQPYAAGSFDHVVSSLVFCSVHDPRQALAEVRRVLRPGGVLHMVEHVRPRYPLLAAAAHAITPAWSQVAYNCHLDRPTVDVLHELGWQVQVHRRLGVFVRLSARL
jgi:ubiquinone/menaquinone biosynthesis C-methylase UbiE